MSQEILPVGQVGHAVVCGIVVERKERPWVPLWVSAQAS